MQVIVDFKTFWLKTIKPFLAQFTFWLNKLACLKCNGDLQGVSLG